MTRAMMGIGLVVAVVGIGVNPGLDSKVMLACAWLGVIAGELFELNRNMRSKAR